MYIYIFCFPFSVDGGILPVMKNSNSQVKAGEEFKLGALIKAWRRKRNLIQKELAAAVDMDATQMWGIENDRNSPSIRTVCRIAEALGITLHELTAPPPGSDSATPQDNAEAPAAGSGILSVPGSDFLPIIRRKEKNDPLTRDLARRLERQLRTICELERGFQTEGSTTLPFSFPFAKNSAGATQLANAIRSHCDIGSAIVRDVRSVFEIHGLRIVETKLPKGTEALSFYQRECRKFTVFLDEHLRKRPWRRDFTLLSEIGWCFLFVSCGCRNLAPRHLYKRFVHEFAASFLLPESSVRSAVYALHLSPDDWTFELLLRMKNRFGVSAEMFNIRMKELGLVSRRLNRTFSELIKRHYRETGFGEPKCEENFIDNRIGDLQARASALTHAGRTATKRHLPTQKREKTASSTSSS